MKSPFLSAVAENMRLKFYAEKTIKSYIHWIKSYIYFINKQHPFSCHNTEVESFLSYLAKKISDSHKLILAISISYDKTSNNAATTTPPLSFPKQ